LLDRELSSCKSKKSSITPVTATPLDNSPALWAQLDCASAAGFIRNRASVKLPEGLRRQKKEIPPAKVGFESAKHGYGIGNKSA
jgi:hypothetical protein